MHGQILDNPLPSLGQYMHVCKQKIRPAHGTMCRHKNFNTCIRENGTRGRVWARNLRPNLFSCRAWTRLSRARPSPLRAWTELQFGLNYRHNHMYYLTNYYYSI